MTKTGDGGGAGKGFISIKAQLLPRLKLSVAEFTQPTEDVLYFLTLSGGIGRSRTLAISRSSLRHIEVPGF